METFADILKYVFDRLSELDRPGAVSTFLLGVFILVSGWFKDAIKEYWKGPIQKLVTQVFNRHWVTLLGLIVALILVAVIRSDLRLYGIAPILIALMASGGLYYWDRTKPQDAALVTLGPLCIPRSSTLIWIAPVLLLPLCFYDRSTRLPDPDVLYLLPPAFVAAVPDVEVADTNPLRRQIYSTLRAGMLEAWPATSPYKFGSRRPNETNLPYIDEEQTPDILDETLKTVEANPPVQYVAFPRIKRGQSALVLFGTTFARKNGIFEEDRILDVEVPDQWQKVAAVMVGFVFAQSALPGRGEPKAEEVLARIFDKKLYSETVERFKGRPPANEVELCIAKHFTTPRVLCSTIGCVEARILLLQRLLSEIPNARDDYIRKVATTSGISLEEPKPFMCDHEPI